MNAEFISNGNIRKHGPHGTRTHVPFVVHSSLDKTALKACGPQEHILRSAFMDCWQCIPFLLSACCPEKMGGRPGICQHGLCLVSAPMCLVPLVRSFKLLCDQISISEQNIPPNNVFTGVVSKYNESD